MTGGTAQPVGRGLARARSHPAGFPLAGHAARPSWPPPPVRPSAGSRPRSRLNSAAAAATREEPRSLPTTGPSTSADTATRPVIDPPEHGHIRAQDRPVRDQHPANDQHAEPGGGHRRVGSSALVRPAVRGPGTTTGSATCPASAPGQPGPRRPRSRPSGCTCRHRCRTSRLTPPLSSRWPDRSAAGPRSRGRRRRRRSRTAW